MKHSKLALLRGARNWTQEELSERSGVHRYTIIKLEHGLTTPSPTTLGKLAEAFGISVEQFQEHIERGDKL